MNRCMKQAEVIVISRFIIPTKQRNNIQTKPTTNLNNHTHSYNNAQENQHQSCTRTTHYTILQINITGIFETREAKTPHTRQHSSPHNHNSRNKTHKSSTIPKMPQYAVVRTDRPHKRGVRPFTLIKNITDKLRTKNQHTTVLQLDLHRHYQLHITHYKHPNTAFTGDIKSHSTLWHSETDYHIGKQHISHNTQHRYIYQSAKHSIATNILNRYHHSVQHTILSDIVDNSTRNII